MGIIYHESSLKALPPQERLDICTSIIKNDIDESLRGEAVWVLGNMIDEVGHDNPISDAAAKLLEWVLKNDNNDVVKHEACFQLGEKNIRKKIPTLINAALNDQSELVRHEAIEALGLLQAFECKEMLHKSLKDKNDAVRQTAAFVLKQLDRLEKAKTVNHRQSLY